MDYTNERYVRVFTRDTVTWKLLDWRARSTLMHLLRKVDRSGVLDVGDDGIAGVAAVIELPLEIVEAGIAQLITRGTVIAGATGYVLPNFLEAQEAVQSDALRAKEYRARHRAKMLGTVTPRDEDVTPRDATVTQSDGPSRASRAPSLQPSLPSEPALAEPRKKRDSLSPRAPVALGAPSRGPEERIAELEDELAELGGDVAHQRAKYEAHGNPNRTYESWLLDSVAFERKHPRRVAANSKPRAPTKKTKRTLDERAAAIVAERPPRPPRAPIAGRPWFIGRPGEPPYLWIGNPDWPGPHPATPKITKSTSVPPGVWLVQDKVDPKIVYFYVGNSGPTIEWNVADNPSAMVRSPTNPGGIYERITVGDLDAFVAIAPMVKAVCS